MRQRPSVFWLQIASIVLTGVSIAEAWIPGLIVAIALLWAAFVTDQGHKKDALKELRGRWAK